MIARGGSVRGSTPRRPRRAGEEWRDPSWTLPEDVPNRIRVKVEAKDRAGNVGSDVSKPVIVDLAQPKGIIVEVEPANKPLDRPAPP